MSLGFLPLAILMLAIFSPTISDHYRLALMNQASLRSLKTFVTSPLKPDSFWETEKVETVTKYIQNYTKDNDYFFVLSSDPIFYYTTKLQNPTRYLISLFADANPLEDEMLKALQNHPPKMILYEFGTYYDRPDLVSMKVRLPKVNSWILANYPNTTVVSGATIKSR